MAIGMAREQAELFYQTTRQRRDILNAPFAQEVMKLAAGRSIWVAATNLDPQFPVIPMIGARWASRGPCLWLILAAFPRE